MQRELGLPPEEARLSILRGPRHTLVQFAGDLPTVLFDRSGNGERRNIAADSGTQPVLMEMMHEMVRHRMRHSHGAFPCTMITPEGPKHSATRNRSAPE